MAYNLIFLSIFLSIRLSVCLIVCLLVFFLLVSTIMSGYSLVCQLLTNDSLSLLDYLCCLILCRVLWLSLVQPWRIDYMQSRWYCIDSSSSSQWCSTTYYPSICLSSLHLCSPIRDQLGQRASITYTPFQPFSWGPTPSSAKS